MKEKSKILKSPKNEKIGYNIFDDKTIESLMHYYKIDNPNVLFDYIKKHRLTKSIDDSTVEKNSA